jgi:thiamine biosynthesis protein ThiS
MNITINGEKKEIPTKVNLSELLENLSLPSERIAIELNKTVVRKKDWENIQITNYKRRIKFSNLVRISFARIFVVNSIYTLNFTL